MNIVTTSYNGVIIGLHYYFTNDDKKREIRFLLFRLLNNHRNESDTLAKFKTHKNLLFNLSSSTRSVKYKAVDTYTATFTFVNPKLIKDENYENDILNLIDEMYVSRTTINKDLFERAKLEVIEQIKALDDNIGSVAGSNIDKLLYDEDTQTKIYGKLENYYDLTYDDVVAELPHFIKSKNFKLSVLGNLSDSFLKRLEEMLPTRVEFPINKEPLTVMNRYSDIKIDKSNKFGQTYLSLIYEFDNPNNDVKTNYEMSIFTNLLGTSSISYLFEEIREAKGYCYYIGAEANLEKNIFRVLSLVSSNKYLDAIFDIDDVVSNVISDFDEERLASTLKRMKDSLLSFKDEAYYESYNQREEYFLKRGLTLDLMIDIIDNTTKESLLALSKTVKPVLKYALVGEKDEEV